MVRSACISESSHLTASETNLTAAKQAPQKARFRLRPLAPTAEKAPPEIQWCHGVRGSRTLESKPSAPRPLLSNMHRKKPWFDCGHSLQRLKKRRRKSNAATECAGVGHWNPNPVPRVPYYLRHRKPPQVFPVTEVFPLRAGRGAGCGALQSR